MKKLFLLFIFLLCLFSCSRVFYNSDHMRYDTHLSKMDVKYIYIEPNTNSYLYLGYIHFENKKRPYMFNIYIGKDLEIVKVINSGKYEVEVEIRVNKVTKNISFNQKFKKTLRRKVNIKIKHLREFYDDFKIKSYEKMNF